MIRRAGCLLVALMVLTLLAGCDRVVEIRVLTGAHLTATEVAALASSSPIATPTTLSDDQAVARGTPTAGATSSPTPSASAPSPTASASAPSPTLSTAAPSPTTNRTPPTATPRPTARVVSAQPPTTRIRFQAGATSGTVRGHLAAGQVQRYVFGASSGQITEVAVSASQSVDLLIRDASRTLASQSGSVLYWQGSLPASHDYYVEVAAGKHAVDYGLRLTIYARIRFAPGHISATVSSSVERLDAEGAEVAGGYVLKALAGQTMKVLLSSPKGDVVLDIVGADGIPLKRYLDGSAEWQGVLPSTQDYLVRAVSVGAATRFTLSVTISALP